MNSKPLWNFIIPSLCGILLVGCSRKTETSQVLPHPQDRHHNVKNVAPNVHETAVWHENHHALKAVRKDSGNNIEPIRNLVKMMLEMDSEGKLNKSELDKIMDQMPQGGSICGIGDVLCKLTTSDNVTDRMDALTLLSAIRRNWTAETQEIFEADLVHSDEAILSDTMSVEIDEASAPISTSVSNGDTIQDLESSLVMDVMTSCLTDPDASVRSAALETALTLPVEERDALALQILGNEDTSLKLTLLSELTDPEHESNHYHPTMV